MTGVRLVDLSPPKHSPALTAGAGRWSPTHLNDATPIPNARDLPRQCATPEHIPRAARRTAVAAFPRQGRPLDEDELRAGVWCLLFILFSYL